MSSDFNTDYNGGSLIAISVVFMVFTTLFIVARFLTRILVKREVWGWDDYMLIPAYITNMGNCGSGIAMVQYAGVGYHEDYIQATQPYAMSALNKLILANIWLYEPSVALAKLSILYLYLRIFKTRASIAVSYCLAVVLMLFPIAMLSASLAQCQPINYIWNKSVQGGHCFNISAFYQSISPPNVATDIVMLILPMRAVWNLETNSVRKVGLSLIFMLGSLGLVASIARTVVFFEMSLLEDQTWITVYAAGLSIIESSMYLIAACALALRPLLTKFVVFWPERRSAHTLAGSSDDLTNARPSDKLHWRSASASAGMGVVTSTASRCDTQATSKSHTSVHMPLALSSKSSKSRLGSRCEELSRAVTSRERKESRDAAAGEEGENYIAMRTDVWVQSSNGDDMSIVRETASRR